MSRTILLIIYLTLIVINPAYANGDPCDPKKCLKCQSDKCVVYVDRENPTNQTILSQILTDVTELKKTIAKIDANSSSNQTEWDKILSIPTFAILIASFVIAVMGIAFAIAGSLGFKSLKDAKKELEAETEKFRGEIKEDIKEMTSEFKYRLSGVDEQSKNVKNLQGQLETKLEEAKRATRFVWFLLNTHLGYIYWTISKFHEIDQSNDTSGEIGAGENITRKDVDELINYAITYTKSAVDKIDGVVILEGLTDEQLEDLNVANTKMNLAFFYAYADKKENKEYALQLVNSAFSKISPLSNIDMIRKNYYPLWIGASFFVNRKFAEKNEEKDDFKKSLEDLRDRHPEFQKEIQEYIDWSNN